MTPPYHISTLQQPVSLLLKALQPICTRVEVAGSYRRKKEFCNDLVFVCIPICLNSLHSALSASAKIQIIRIGEQNIFFRLGTGIQVDLFIAHAGKRDLLEYVPSNWGSILLCRTGPKEHNVWPINRCHWPPVSQ